MEKNRLSQIATISVDQIVPDPDNLREQFDEDDIKALGDNILEHGQMDPIQVFERDDHKYQIFDGERRWRAHRIAHIQYITAIVIPRPPQEELISKRVSRAMQSRNLTPQEELRALEDALNALGVYSKPEEWSRVAKKLGLPPQLLRDRMRIARLSRPVRSQFEEGELDLSAAQALGRLGNSNRQVEVARFIKDNQLHTRFVGTKFIEKLVQNPDKPVLEVYTIAQSEMRDPGKISHIPRKDETIADRLEDILADFRRAETWIEASGKEGLIMQLRQRQDTMGLSRLIEEVHRLLAMCNAFIKHTANNKENEDIVGELPEAQSTNQ